MRLHYLSSSRLPSLAANSVHVTKMCSAFAEAGIDTTLVALCGDDTDEAIQRYYGTRHQFRIERIRPSAASEWTALRLAIGARRSVARAQPDIVYGRNVHSMALVAGLARRSILEVHAPPATSLQRLSIGRVVAARGFSHLVAISDALATEYRRLFPGLGAAQVRVVHDGADDPGEPGPIAGAPNGRLRIGYAGHLYPGKGMEILVQAAALMTEAEFAVYGGTPADLATWRARGLTPNVTLHGHLPHSTIPERLRDCDVLLAPYQRVVTVHTGSGDVANWMSPLKIFEYMAAAKPIVASDLPVLREVLVDQRNALMVPPEDPASWIAAIRRIGSDAQLATRLGSSARADFLAHYTWAARARRVLD